MQIGVRRQFLHTLRTRRLDPQQRPIQRIQIDLALRPDYPELVDKLNAKNVKIIARNGNITLKGPVDSQQEKETIGTKAGEIAGKNKVDNRLEVKSKKK